MFHKNNSKRIIIIIIIIIYNFFLLHVLWYGVFNKRNIQVIIPLPISMLIY